MDDVNYKKVKSIIECMDDGSFGAFQRELQYALRWHQIGYDISNAAMFFSEGAHAGRQIHAYSSHETQKKMLEESLLYRIVREDIRRRTGKNIEDNWYGWVGLPSTNTSTESIKSINNAIRVMLRQNYEPSGLVDFQTSDDKASERQQADDVLNKICLKGIFIDSKNSEDLMDAFMKTYKND
ncbi:MAG: hypothetical protein HZB65_03765 [Candidatus Aenigmarchaeota archaeon]|nr:hypothetical protein [Candidatus Aenigmarchaeota archaeon]